MNRPLPLIPLLEPIRPDLEQVEHLLRSTVADAEEPLCTMLRHVLDGGKRLRPTLAILVGRMFDGPPAPFQRLGAALDLLHAATLVHDDVVDEAPLRRGHETLHTVWPAGATVLAGDYLLAQAITLLADLEQPRVLKVFGAVLRTMCAGEIRQALVARGQQTSRGDYYRSAEAKTAALFAATMEMAGLLAGADEPELAALRRFGREFGLAFQIVDDVLDLTGDQAQLGKPAGSDLRQGLVTLPVLCYLEQTAPPGDAPVRAVLAGQRGEEHVRAAIAVICASPAIEAALEEAQAHVGRSQAALAPLADTAARRTLHALADYVVARNH